jgi:hypothetical protein
VHPLLRGGKDALPEELHLEDVSLNALADNGHFVHTLAQQLRVHRAVDNEITAAQLLQLGRFSIPL